MKCPVVRRGAVLATLLVAFVSFGAVPSDAADGSASCAAASPGDDIERALKRTHPPGPTEPDMVPLCYHQGGIVLLAPIQGALP